MSDALTITKEQQKLLEDLRNYHGILRDEEIFTYALRVLLKISRMGWNVNEALHFLEAHKTNDRLY